MEKRIVEIKGRLIEFEGNKPVRWLTPHEAEEVRRKSTPQYQASQLSNEKLLEQFVDLLLRGVKIDDESTRDQHHAKVMAYMTEILLRMNQHKKS